MTMMTMMTTRRKTSRFRRASRPVRVNGRQRVPKPLPPTAVLPRLRSGKRLRRRTGRGDLLLPAARREQREAEERRRKRTGETRLLVPVLRELRNLARISRSTTTTKSSVRGSPSGLRVIMLRIGDGPRGPYWYQRTPCPDLARFVSTLDAVKSPNSALQQVAEDWIESYKEESGPAMAELVNFVLRVGPRLSRSWTGCPPAKDRSCGTDSFSSDLR